MLVNAHREISHRVNAHREIGHRVNAHREIGHKGNAHREIGHKGNALLVLTGSLVDDLVEIIHRVSVLRGLVAVPCRVVSQDRPVVEQACHRFPFSSYLTVTEMVNYQKKKLPMLLKH